MSTDNDMDQLESTDFDDVAVNLTKCIKKETKEVRDDDDAADSGQKSPCCGSDARSDPALPDLPPLLSIPALTTTSSSSSTHAQSSPVQQSRHKTQQSSLSHQLQQFMQHQQQHQALLLQQTSQHKLQEHLLHQLQEQLQINVLQQAQLMQQANQDKKLQNSSQMHMQLQQLAMHQHQLVQQIQLQHRNYLISQGMGSFQHMGIVPQGLNGVDVQQLWKDVSRAVTDDVNKAGSPNGLLSTGLLTYPGSATNSSLLPQLNAFNGADRLLQAGLMTSLGVIKPNDLSLGHPLYAHGACKWPGCDVPIESLEAFNSHIDQEHILSDRSTAQTRVQMQLVAQLEMQLTKERGCLQAMMLHLHAQPTRTNLNPGTHKPENGQDGPLNESRNDYLTPINTPISQTPSQPRRRKSSQPQQQPSSTMKLSTPSSLPSPGVRCSPQTEPPVLSLKTEAADRTSSRSNSSSSSGSVGPIRRRVSDKCNLPISTEITRNRDFYKSTDVRPPFTYASLIRQAIVESTHRQLTLNEIYQWFTSTFCYFRRNEATWKNAVRHNLSLHKCFMRVENVKGAVWTVDELEFYRRRPQKIANSPHSIKDSPTLVPPQKSFSDRLSETFSETLRATLSRDTEMAAGFTPTQHRAMSLSSGDGHVTPQQRSDDGDDSLAYSYYASRFSETAPSTEKEVKVKRERWDSSYHLAAQSSDDNNYERSDIVGSLSPDDRGMVRVGSPRHRVVHSSPRNGTYNGSADSGAYDNHNHDEPSESFSTARAYHRANYSENSHCSSSHSMDTDDAYVFSDDRAVGYRSLDLSRGGATYQSRAEKMSRDAQSDQSPNIDSPRGAEIIQSRDDDMSRALVIDTVSSRPDEERSSCTSSKSASPIFKPRHHYDQSDIINNEPLSLTIHGC